MHAYWQNEQMSSPLTGSYSADKGRPAISLGIVKNFGYLLGGSVAAQMLGLIAGILSARWLGAAVLGEIRTALAVAAPVGILVELGLDRVLIRACAQRPGMQAPNVCRLMTLRVVLSMAAIGCLAVVLLFVPYSPSTRWIALLVSPYLLLQGLAATALIPFLAQQEGRLVAETQLLRQGAYLGALAALLWWWPSAFSVVAALLFGHLLATVYALIRMSTRIGGIRLLLPGMAFLRTHLPPAFWFFATTLLGIFLVQIDILMLSLLRTEQETGTYAVAWSLLQTLLMGVSALYFSLLPVSSARVGKAYFRGLAWRLLQVSALSVAMAAAIAWMAEPIIVLLYGRPFAPAAGALRILVWVFPVHAAAHWYVQLFDATENQKIHVFNGTIMLATSVVLQLLLIPRYGIEGAAWATLAGNATSLASSAPFAVRLFRRLK